MGLIDQLKDNTSLNWETIQANINPKNRVLIEQYFILETVDSTNTFIADYPSSPGTMTVCMAEKQTAGKGRQGKAWYSSPNKNIMLSINWHFSKWLDNLPLASLAVAVAISEALSETGIETQVKWPNDIYLKGKKVGGILIETNRESTDACRLIIGCGINVDVQDMDEDIDQPYTDLNSYLPENLTTISRNHVIALILDNFCEILTQFSFPVTHPVIIKLWKQRALFLNETVLIYRKSSQSLLFKGVIIDVTDNGSLVLETENGKRHELLESDVTIRLFEQSRI